MYAIQRIFGDILILTTLPRLHMQKKVSILNFTKVSGTQHFDQPEQSTKPENILYLDFTATVVHLRQC